MLDDMREQAHRRWPAQHGLLGALGNGTRIALWGVLQFTLNFIEQIAELLAPLLFVAGLGWWAAIHLVSSIELDDPNIQKLVRRFPASLTLSGHFLTPHILIVDGLWLMALVAACRTAEAIIAKET